MARRPSARHARPAGRGALKAAYADLVRELAAERSARHGDQLELVRLAALADGLTAQLAALSTELADTRRELRLAVTTPRAAPAAPGPDPYVTLLAGQVADLRALVLAQQQSLAELTSRLVDLLERATAPPLRPPAPAAAPVPSEVQAPPSAPPDVAQDGPIEAHQSPPDARAFRAPAPPEPAPAIDLEDETVHRLRSIRSSLGR